MANYPVDKIIRPLNNWMYNFLPSTWLVLNFQDVGRSVEKLRPVSYRHDSITKKHNDLNFTLGISEVKYQGTQIHSVDIFYAFTNFLIFVSWRSSFLLYIVVYSWPHMYRLSTVEV